MKIDYNISEQYCASWTAYDAIREIVQNAIDSGKDFYCDADSLYTIISCHGVDLPLEVFTLGVSQKFQRAIGKYGEGFKIAMMVLTREGLHPEMTFGKYRVTGEFRPHEVTGVDTFKLVFEELSEPCSNLTFIFDTGYIDLEVLEERVTQFGDEPLGRPEQEAELLEKKIGYIYVNGLFVTVDKHLKYGYNFRPDSIKLNRDRDIAAGVTWTLAKLYGRGELVDIETLFNMVIEGAHDVNDLRYHLTPEISKGLGEEYLKRFGTKPIDLIGTGDSNDVTYLSVSAYMTLANCNVQLRVKEPVECPHKVLSEFLDTYKELLDPQLLTPFNALIEKAKNWSA